MAKPTCFGYPLWIGRVPARLRKRSFIKARFKFLKQFCKYSSGSLIRSCTGMNFVVTDVQPIYRRTGRFGYTLVDVDLSGRHESCSLANCCNHPLSGEETKKYINMLICSDTLWAERYKSINIFDDGTWDYACTTTPPIRD